jgi:hypothetical protein
VSLGDEGVQVELGRDLAAALDLHVAHAAVGVGAAAGEQRGHQRRQARHGVGAGAVGLAHHVHGHRAQLAEVDVDGHALVQAGDRGADHVLRFAGLDAGQRHGADGRNRNGAVAVDGGAIIDIDRAPAANLQFIARPERVVGLHRRVRHRRESRRCIGEKRRAENRQQFAGIVGDEFLEFARLFFDIEVAVIQLAILSILAIQAAPIQSAVLLHAGHLAARLRAVIGDCVLTAICIAEFADLVVGNAQTALLRRRERAVVHAHAPGVGRRRHVLVEQVGPAARVLGGRGNGRGSQRYGCKILRELEHVLREMRRGRL